MAFKKFFITALVLSLAALTVFAGPSFFGGVSASNNTITVSGVITGIPNDISRVQVYATIFSPSGDVICTNNGGKVAPGQQDVVINVTSPRAFPTVELNNGKAPFSVEVDILGNTSASCPNGNWTEEFAGSFSVTAVVQGCKGDISSCEAAGSFDWEDVQTLNGCYIDQNTPNGASVC